MRLRWRSKLRSDGSLPGRDYGRGPTRGGHSIHESRCPEAVVGGRRATAQWSWPKEKTALCARLLLRGR